MAMRVFGTFLTGLVLSGLVLSATVASAQDAPQTRFSQEPEIANSTAVGETAPQKTEPAPPVAEGPVPSWIWGADQTKNYVFKFEFETPNRRGVLRAACDNSVTVKLNGQKVLENNEWARATEVELNKQLKPGKNVLIAEARNAGGPAAFLLKLTTYGRDGQGQQFISDENWLAADKADATEWAKARVIGKLGIQPYGDIFKGPSTPEAPRDIFNLPPGFQVERLFTVPKDKLGSWVSITTDPQGRLLVSDQQDKGLCRVTPAPLGGKGETIVEKLPVKITSAQGMLHVGDALYLSINGGPGSGIYRTILKGNEYGEVQKLKSLAGGGEHGPHALRLGPDKQTLYVVCGNFTDPPKDLGPSPVPHNWQEDLLLPRQWDANGHAVGRYAPGGWVGSFEVDGQGTTNEAQNFQIFSMGYRNSYDMDFNADGELFVYDSDMEWDLGMPWYRPTRVVHATSGSEFGWRSGTGVWPTSHLDSLPPLVDIGPGSPVGVTFGYGTKFPAKYQKALYILDWTFGTIYALHLEPQGASYRAVKEEFVSRTPLPLTDAVVGQDGAFYFLIGGRGTQSELFRVTYVGSESTAPAELKNAAGAEARALRHKLESYQRTAADPAAAVAFIYPHLSHEDRFIRFAARVALEHQPAALWQAKVLQEANPEGLFQGAVAFARQGDAKLEPQLLAQFQKLDFAALSEPLKLDYLRSLSLVFLRLGAPDEKTAKQFAERLQPLFPTASEGLNRELLNMLVYLKSAPVVRPAMDFVQQPSPTVTPEISAVLARNPGYGGTVARMLANQPEAQKIHYAFALRNLSQGWTLPERKAYFKFLDDQRSKSGGASYQGFLKNIQKDALENVTDIERLALQKSGLLQPYRAPELPKPKGPGQEWTMEQVLTLGQDLQGRNFENGRRAFAAARCVVCHRFAGDGGATGPDLTQLAGRFNLKDLTEAILDPSKVISDQYKQVTIETADGRVVNGRIIVDNADHLIVLTDPEDSTKLVEIRKADIDGMTPSPLSIMPKDLLKTLNQDEVRDLLAYLLSRGNPQDAMFRR